jgi:hypothetical protein
MMRPHLRLLALGASVSWGGCQGADQSDTRLPPCSSLSEAQCGELGVNRDQRGGDACYPLVGSPVNQSSVSKYFGCYSGRSCSETTGKNVCATNPTDEKNYRFETVCSVPDQWKEVDCNTASGVVVVVDNESGSGDGGDGGGDGDGG